MKRRIATVLLVLASTVLIAQQKRDVLLTIDGAPVYVNEFKRVYKKNLELVQDESQKNVDGYLNLFIDYKLKVAEARAQGFHKTANYEKEFSKYQDQLSRNYIYEDKFIEDVAREAYERGLEQIDANHIIIRSSYNDSPQDTLTAYNKIKSIRDKVLAGADFVEMAKQFSEEPEANTRAGHLGYFSAFSMVYPFESMAYNTAVGEVSEIVRTQFGYHIIKVNDRREVGNELEVSHIMVAFKKDDPDFNAKGRIDEIYALLEQGSSFEDLARQYSDDTNSAKKDGKLRAFKRGQLRAPAFEEAAYALANPGDVSEPIKTEFGWHILRLEKINAPKTFEEQKEQLIKRVQSGNRSKKVTAAISNKIKEKYGFTQGSAYRPFFDTLVTDSILTRGWKNPGVPESQDKVLFTIGSRSLKYSDFANFITERQPTAKMSSQKGQVIKDLYNEFESKALGDYFKEQLEVENDEYAGIISEYRDGLLIFDVMNANVWDKARKDTLGLERYFETVKDNYMWDTRAKTVFLFVTEEETAKEAKKMMEEGIVSDEIKDKLNGSTAKVIASKGTFELDWREFPDNFELKKGVSKIYEQGDSYVIVDVEEILPPGPKTLEDVRGKVLSNYQNLVENEWMESLRSKYNVSINKKNLKKAKKELTP